jgi:hypothetical protein
MDDEVTSTIRLGRPARSAPSSASVSTAGERWFRAKLASMPSAVCHRFDHMPPTLFTSSCSGAFRGEPLTERARLRQHG